MANLYKISYRGKNEPDSGRYTEKYGTDKNNAIQRWEHSHGSKNFVITKVELIQENAIMSEYDHIFHA